jgi:hypothetical protein
VCEEQVGHGWSYAFLSAAVFMVIGLVLLITNIPWAPPWVTHITRPDFFQEQLKRDCCLCRALVFRLFS